jgi:SAM-dependent methyltransferase
MSRQIKRQPPDFELRWQKRFRDYGDEHDDDAAIAGWTPTGLATRLRHFERHFSSRVTGHWLDAGCGAGTYTRLIARRGAHVVGIDYSAPSALKARARDAGDNLYLVADVTQLPFLDECFDGVVCFGVTQSLSSSAGVVAALACAVRVNGQVWIDALNARCLPSAVSEKLRKLRGLPPRLRYERHETIAELLRANGFGAIRVVWLPIMPGRLHRLQWVFESLPLAALFRMLPVLGVRLSHSFVILAEKNRSVPTPVADPS